jgi:opacity protein-like surface antigen
MARSLFLACLVLLAAVAGAAPARAQGDFGRPGIYIGGSWFRLGEQFGDELDDELDEALDLDSPRLSVGDTDGLAAILGVRLGERFALELVGERYEDLDIDLSVAGLTASGDLELYAGMVQGKLYLLTGFIQPYLMVGGGYLRGRIDFAGADEVGHAALGRAGAGIELYLARNWAFNVQAAYSRGISSDFDDLKFFTVGGSVILRF